MSDEKSTYPRRDAEGRIQHLPDLIGVVLAGLVIGVLAVVVFDAGFALLGQGEFGRSNGWLAVILPAWLFVEEFRAWSYGPARIAAALVAAAVSITAGLLAAGLVNELPPLASGSIAAGAFALVYSLIWFYGVRWLAHRVG